MFVVADRFVVLQDRSWETTQRGLFPVLGKSSPSGCSLAMASSTEVQSHWYIKSIKGRLQRMHSSRSMASLTRWAELSQAWSNPSAPNKPIKPNKRIYQTNQMNQTISLHWYALRTRSRHEKIVRDQLAIQGIEQLLPTVKRLSQWKDRKKEIEVPLFSGYCFVRLASEQKLTVLKTIGVVDIVGASHCPEPVPDEEIVALKTLMTSVLVYDAHPYLHEGMRVEVVRGPLQGVHGILLRKEKRHRLVLGIRLIQQAAVVEIEVSDVVPL